MNMRLSIYKNYTPLGNNPNDEKDTISSRRKLMVHPSRALGLVLGIGPTFLFILEFMVVCELNKSFLYGRI